MDKTGEQCSETSVKLQIVKPRKTRKRKGKRAPNHRCRCAYITRKRSLESLEKPRIVEKKRGKMYVGN